MKKFFKVKVFTLVVISSLILSLSSSQVFSLTENNENTPETICVAKSDIKSDEERFLLSKEKIEGISLLAERFALPFEEIIEKLHFKENCYLVPLLNLDEHKECLLDLFSNARQEYIKYYLSGKLRTPEETEKIYFIKSLENIWKHSIPRSLNFIIDCDNASIGRIAVGPLFDRKNYEAEIGYIIKENYSGQGIVSEAVKTLLNFIQYLTEKGIYNLEKIRATAKENNIASNKILAKNGFIKSLEMVDDGYLPENEYFYYLDIQKSKDVVENSTTSSLMSN